jgi:AraC-like DNA-binding protein
VLVPTNYLNNIVGLAEEYGACREAILKDAGVSQESLDDPEARIDAEAFARVIVDALEQSGEPALGIRLGSQLRVTTHGILGYAAMASATLAEALSLITRYVQTRTPLLVASFSVRRGIATLRIEEAAILGEIRRPLLEISTATVNAVARFLTDGEFECESVRFPFAEPEYAAEYRAVFGCPVLFGAEAAEIRFDSSFLARPLLLADEAAKLQAAKRCEEELLAIEKSDDLEQRIRARLLKTTDLILSLDQVAKDLAMSPRTVRRRLQNSGTSFQRVLNSVRKDLAIDYLRTTPLAVSEIADRLGYTNQSSFGRAFKGWTGLSPRHFRERS